MTIDCTLDNLKIPALPTYVNEFGTKKPNGGLTTAECTDDAMLPFRKMRPYEINEDAETTEIQHNAVFVAKAANITLTLHDCSDSFLGCEARVINVSSGNITVKGGVSGIDGGTAGITVPAKREIRLIFLSDGWHSSYDDFCNITEKEIADSAVTTDKINTSAVTSAKIADANVTEHKIGSNAVTESKIAASAVTTDKINTSAVTTTKIKDANVTTDKIANNAVTSEKLASGLTLSGTTSGSFKGTLTGNATNVTGVVAVANGGTGATTAAQGINNLAVGLEEGTSIPSDNMGFITTYADSIETNGGLHGIYKRSGSKVWEWIQSKISSVLGLTKESYGGTASKTNQLQAFTGDNFTGGNHFIKAIRNSDGWGMRLKTCYDGGTAQSNDISVGYADKAGIANSVAWDNVSGKPAYITGSYSNGVLNLYTN